MKQEDDMASITLEDQELASAEQALTRDGLMQSGRWDELPIHLPKVVDVEIDQVLEQSRADENGVVHTRRFVRSVTLHFRSDEDAAWVRLRHL